MSLRAFGFLLLFLSAALASFPAAVQDGRRRISPSRPAASATKRRPTPPPPHGRAMAGRRGHAATLLRRLPPADGGAHRRSVAREREAGPASRVLRRLSLELRSALPRHPRPFPPWGRLLRLPRPAHEDGESEDVPVHDHLLVAEPFELCGDCHGIQAAAAHRPFAHRDGAEPFSCLACHSTHGTTRVGRLLAGGNGGVCLDCHGDKAGPFVFPHPPGRSTAASPATSPTARPTPAC